MLLLAMGLGALVKPPATTPGPPSSAKAAPAPAQAPQQPAQQAKAKATSPPAAAAPGFANPSKIAACLAPLGFETGKLQVVSPGQWATGSAKKFHGADRWHDWGEVCLNVSGPSPIVAGNVELLALSRSAQWARTRSELLSAVRLVFKYLQLPACDELTQAIKADTGERAGAAEFMVGSVKVNYVTDAPAGDLRSARVALTASSTGRNER